MDNICRICMTQSKRLIPMIKEVSKSKYELLDIGNHFEEYLGVQVNELLCFHKICKNCNNRLTGIHAFKLLAIESNKKLKELFQSQNSEFASKENINSYKLDDEALNLDEENVSIEDDEKKEDEAHKVAITYSDNNESKTEEFQKIELLSSGFMETFNFIDINAINNDKEENLDSFNGDRENRYVKSENQYNLSEVQGEDNEQLRKLVEIVSYFPYNCQECNKKFGTKISFKAHQNIHKGLPAYCCKICGKTFKVKPLYDYHMKKHNNIREFKCDSCEKCFLSRGDLKMHKLTHADTKPFVCHICGKQFKKNFHLASHLETHSSTRQYECPICLQKYKTQTTLKGHMDFVHLKRKEHKCPICYKIFYRQYTFKVHLKVHEKSI